MDTVPTLSRPLALALKEKKKREEMDATPRKRPSLSDADNQTTLDVVDQELMEMDQKEMQLAPPGTWFSSPMPSPNPDQQSHSTVPSHPTLPRASHGEDGIGVGRLEGNLQGGMELLSGTEGKLQANIVENVQEMEKEQTTLQGSLHNHPPGGLGLSMLDLNLGLGLVHHSLQDPLDYDNAPTFADTLPPTPTVLDAPPLPFLDKVEGMSVMEQSFTHPVTHDDVVQLRANKESVRVNHQVLVSGNAILLGPLANRKGWEGGLDAALEREVIQEEGMQPMVDKMDGGWFEFRIAAACRPKNPRGTDRLPEICKVDAGEDAYFIQNGQESLMLGVADGVGGWTSLGVDPSLFAWDLMNCCSQVADSQSQLGILDTSTCLSEGYRRVKEEGRVEAGSSTACLVGLDKRTGHLHTTNLGDSGAIVIRPSPPPPGAMLEPTDPPLQFHIPFRTTDLQHYFNAPFQLSVLPPPMREDPTNIVDSPADAVNEEFGGDPTHGGGVKEGDVIVVGTDGVWDNLWEEEIVDRLREKLGGLGDGWIPLPENHQSSLNPAGPWYEEDSDEEKIDYYGSKASVSSDASFEGRFCSDPTVSAASGGNPVKKGEGEGVYKHVPMDTLQRWRLLDQKLKQVAAQLCVDARDAAKNARKPSPFARNARRAGHLHFGGKLDDVTVVLAYVVRVPPPVAPTGAPGEKGALESVGTGSTLSGVVTGGDGMEDVQMESKMRIVTQPEGVVGNMEVPSTPTALHMNQP